MVQGFPTPHLPNPKAPCKPPLKFLKLFMIFQGKAGAKKDKEMISQDFTHSSGRSGTPVSLMGACCMRIQSSSQFPGGSLTSRRGGPEEHGWSRGTSSEKSLPLGGVGGSLQTAALRGRTSSAARTRHPIGLCDREDTVSPPKSSPAAAGTPGVEPCSCHLLSG